MHEQNVICSKTQLDSIAHEYTIICRQLFAGHVVALGQWKGRKKNAPNDNEILVFKNCEIYKESKAKESSHIFFVESWHL